MRVLMDESVRRKWIKNLCELLTVCGTNNKIILRALADETFRDFEDALQDCYACFEDLDYIVTVNIKDYRDHSVIPALTPSEFLSQL